MITSLGSLFQYLTTLLVRNFILMSNLNFPWHSFKPFAITGHQKEVISTSLPLCSPSWANSGQQWGHLSASSFLSWTNLVSSEPKSCPLVLSPSLLPVFGHILIFYTMEPKPARSTLRWGHTTIEIDHLFWSVSYIVLTASQNRIQVVLWATKTHY